jgi:carbonic anhydrase/acetyltransferase-like protein (isoleucine patch superfamily)
MTMKKNSPRIRFIIKTFLNGVCLALVSPCALLCWIEARITNGSESTFLFWAHLFAMFPGRLGVFLRRAYYRLTLDRCAANFYIGFGALFTHRSALVEMNAYIGAYALVGSAHLGEGCLIGSRASLLSGTALHALDEQGRWGPCDQTRMRQIKIGDYAWIGEGAIVMANIGAGTMVAAGAVVEQDARAGILLAGNPSRFVRKLMEDPHLARPQDSTSSSGVD